MSSSGSRVDVAVVGAGPIGLAIAWRLARAGLRVCVFDAGEPHAAWRVSAGMLSPATELDYGHEHLSLLARAALEGYPAFIAELEAESGARTGYSRAGSLTLALDRDEVEALRRRHLFLTDAVGLAVSWLRASECRALEPLLSPRVAAGISAPADAQVDPRALVAALRAAVARSGASLREARVDELVREAGRVAGVRAGADVVAATTVVLAAGAWSGSLAPDVPLRPLKGQILRLQAETRPRLLLRGSEEVYLFGRASGEVVLGATVDEQGFDGRATAGGAYRLLEEAHRLVPGASEWALTEIGVGFRPTSPDRSPLLGEIEPGLVLATGHHRNGILLAPLTADAVTHLLEHGQLPPLCDPFTIDRFGNGHHRDHAQRQAVSALG